PDGRTEVVSIARPDTLVRIRCPVANETELRQFALLRSAAGHPVVNAAAGISEDSLIASDDTGRKVLTGRADNVRYTHQVITKAEIERESWCDFPIIPHEKVDLILMPIADLSYAVIGMSGIVEGIPEVEKLRIRRFLDLKLLHDRIHGTRE